MIKLYSVVDVEQLDQVLHQMVLPVLGKGGVRGGRWEERGERRGGWGSPRWWWSPRWSKGTLGTSWSPWRPGSGISHRWGRWSWVSFWQFHSSTHWAREPISCSCWGVGWSHHVDAQRGSFHVHQRDTSIYASHAHHRVPWSLHALSDVVLGAAFQRVALPEERTLKTCSPEDMKYFFGNRKFKMCLTEGPVTSGRFAHLYERQISASCVCFLKAEIWSNWNIEQRVMFWWNNEQFHGTSAGLDYMDSAWLCEPHVPCSGRLGTWGSTFEEGEYFYFLQLCNCTYFILHTP